MNLEFTKTTFYYKYRLFENWPKIGHKIINYVGITYMSEN